MPSYQGHEHRQEEKQQHRHCGDEAQHRDESRQAKKQEHDGACENPPPTASEPEHVTDSLMEREATNWPTACSIF